MIEDGDLFQNLEGTDGRAALTLEERLWGAGQFNNGVSTAKENDEYRRLIRTVAAEISLSEGATVLLETHYDNATTLADAAAYLKLSKQDYDKYRQELHRTREAFKKRLRPYIQ